MDTPLLILNFKAYPEAVGPRALELARIAEEQGRETGRSVAVAPFIGDLARVASEVSLPVLAQHCDDLPAGSQTGWIPPEAVREVGAVGTLLNHAERPLLGPTLRATVERCHALGLETVVCADDTEAAKAATASGPTFLAVEPPELIGGDVSVTTANPRVVKETVAQVEAIDPDVRVLCGAGIKTGADVRAALELGTKGVLLASGVVRAPSPREALADLLAGLGT
ncbi:MAG: triose-phosphate isomerase [Thermoplasmata archaeon]|nr:triose-phosphate isomerase [Thermoplasmata archaeon]